MLNTQSQLIAAGVSRAQSEHAIAVLMGRPPAGLSIANGALAARTPAIPATCRQRFWSAGPTSRRRRRRCARPMPDRRRLRRIFPRHLAVRPVRLFRRSLRAAAGRRIPFGRSALARPAGVQRRPHRRAGRGGARDLSVGRRHLSPDGVDRDPAGRRPVSSSIRILSREASVQAEAVRAFRQATKSRSTNTAPAPRISPPSSPPRLSSWPPRRPS